jgi:hypothetical protein
MQAKGQQLMAEMRTLAEQRPEVLQALAHTKKAEAAAASPLATSCFYRIKTNAVVYYLNLQLIMVLRQGDGHTCGLGVFDNVEQQLTDSPEKKNRKIFREPFAISVIGVVDPDTMLVLHPIAETAQTCLEA